MGGAVVVEPLLTVREVAAWFRVGEQWVRDTARAGRLPGARKVGDEWRFDRLALERWLKDETEEVEKA